MVGSASALPGLLEQRPGALAEPLDEQLRLFHLALLECEDHLDVGQLHVQVAPFEEMIALLRQPQQAPRLVALATDHLGQRGGDQHRHFEEGSVLPELDFDPASQGDAQFQIVLLQRHHRLHRQRGEVLVAHRPVAAALPQRASSSSMIRLASPRLRSLARDQTSVRTRIG